MDTCVSTRPNICLKAALKSFILCSFNRLPQLAHFHAYSVFSFQSAHSLCEIVIIFCLRAEFAKVLIKTPFGETRERNAHAFEICAHREPSGSCGLCMRKKRLYAAHSAP
jgi:hypothetical protein